eukprot:gene7610-1359_t
MRLCLRHLAQSPGPSVRSLIDKLGGKCFVSGPHDIRWGDMDAYAHVNNTVYLRLIEEGRIHYFRTLMSLSPDGADGKLWDEFMTARGVAPILGYADCKFKAPLEHPDRVMVAVWTPPEHVKEDRWVTRSQVISLGSGVVAAEGMSTLVTYDYPNQRKAHIPAFVKRALHLADDQLHMSKYLRREYLENKTTEA